MLLLILLFITFDCYYYCFWERTLGRDSFLKKSGGVQSVSIGRSLWRDGELGISCFYVGDCGEFGYC